MTRQKTQRGRQLLQWLTSKLKDSLQNRRYVFAFSGEHEADVKSVIHAGQPGRCVCFVLA